MGYRPSVHQLHHSAYGNDTWVVCPTCHGGRGAIEQHVDESGNPRHSIIRCPTCQGRKVIERPQVDGRPESEEL
jgi:DnaJ-class molecular chaperone